MKTKMKGCLVILAIFVGLLARPAEAFTLLYGSGITSIGWQKSEIIFDVDTSCASFMDDVNGAIGQAQDLWNHAPSSALKLSIGGSVTLPSAITTYVGSSASQVAPVGNPILYCDTHFQADSGEPADEIPGFAGAQNMLSSGLLQGGLLVLNFESGARANVHTLGSALAAIVLAHEMGHVLGLGHSSDADALMYYSTGTTRKLILAQDDIDGISYLYPRQEPGSGGFLGCGTLSVAGSGGGAASRRFGGGSSNAAGGVAEFTLVIAFAAWITLGRFRERIKKMAYSTSCKLMSCLEV